MTITATPVSSDFGIAVELSASSGDTADSNRVVITRFGGEDASGTIVLRRSFVTGTAVSASFTDIAVASDVTYTYTARLFAGITVMDTVTSSEASVSFNGLTIADNTGSWHTELGMSDSDMSIQLTRKHTSKIVETLSGKYPHVVVNADTDYYSGSVTALFLPLDSDGYPTITGANAYKERFMSFLTNGKEKMLRTHDGKSMVVAIGESIRENWSKYDGASTISFDWTQTGSGEAAYALRDGSVTVGVIIT